MTRRELLLYFGGFGLLLAVFAAFAFRPSPILGVDGQALSDSLNNEAFVDAPPCLEFSEGWRCEVVDTSGNRAALHVSVDFWGCWIGKAGGLPRREGCITLLDH